MKSTQTERKQKGEEGDIADRKKEESETKKIQTDRQTDRQEAERKEKKKTKKRRRREERTMFSRGGGTADR